MEDADLEPLASEISTRTAGYGKKGLWSSRVVDRGSKGTGKNAADAWANGLKQSERSVRVYSLLAEVRTADEDGRFVQALSAYREAATLSRSDSALKDAAFDFALKEINSLAAGNWRVAAALLQEAVALDSNRPMPESVRTNIEQAAREETVVNALAEFKPGGDLEQANARLTRALRQYPNEPRLENQLAMVGPLLMERLGPAERKRRLAIFNRLRAEAEGSAQIEEAERCLLKCEEALGPYRFDSEIFGVHRCIRRQVEKSRSALRAYVQGRPAECLQDCSQILQYTPQQPLLVALREKARSFPFSSEATAQWEAKALVDRGPLAEAHTICTRAGAQFPESQDLKSLAAAIQEKEATVRGLLNAGEERLLRGEVEAAGKLFLQALDLLPSDPELEQHMAALLHSQARTYIDQNWRSFEACLELLRRIQPERPLPADLEGIAHQRKQHAEATRQKAEAIHKTAERGLQADVLRESNSKPVTEEKKQPESAGELEAREHKVTKAVLVKPATTAKRLTERRRLDKTTAAVLSAVAATLVGATFVAWQDHQAHIVIERQKNKLEKLIPATEKGLTSKAATPGWRGATLEIRGAEPGTEVRVDNVLLGAAVSGSSLTRKLSSGDHVVELSRDGFNPKRMALHFAPGEAALLAGSDVQLQSTDASLLSGERRDWARLSSSQNVAELQDFGRKYPNTAHAEQAKTEVRRLEWQSVDKNSIPALEAYIAANPNSPYTVQGRETIEAITRESTERTEQKEWDSVNKTSKTALAAFAEKYPNGSHASAANGLMADIDQKMKVAQALEQTARVQQEQTQVASVNVPRSDEKRQLSRSGAETMASLKDPSVTESAAVLDVLGRFAHAWNAKDYQSILAIEPDLNRRVLKAQLSPVKAVTMRISPVGPPQISGTQATVVCRRQADETFFDGSLKQNPESIVTYVLGKRNGLWDIEAIR